MSFDSLLQSVPAFVLIFFRIAGMMMMAPLFGSSRIPRILKVLMALVITMAMAGSVPLQVSPPASPWLLAVGIGGELIFGLAMGMILSFSFIAVQWSGEMIGQQMGLNLSEVFDPQFGAQGSLIGDMYYMLTLVVFLAAGGHRLLLRGVHESFTALPLLSIGMNDSLLDLMIGLFQGATMLALRLAGPVFVTMLVVDVALGFIGKTMPQFNVMSAGLSLRSVLGLVVLIIGLSLTSDVISQSVTDSMYSVAQAWTSPSLAGR